MIRSALTCIVTRETELHPVLSQLNNRQRWYSYRLRAQPIIQLTQDIVSITLKEGDKQLQADDQLEGDDEWSRPSGRKLRTLRQRIAALVVEGTDIGVDTRFKITTWVTGKRFPSKVSVLSSGDDKLAEKEADRHIHGLLEVSIWSEESSMECRRTGAEVAWMPQREWKIRRVYLSTTKEVFE